MPEDLMQKYKKLIYDFIWEGKMQMILQKRISMPKHMGGTGHIDIGARQKAIWLKQLNDITDNPNVEYNKLIRSTIGPNTKLKRILQEKNSTIEEIAYSELTHKPKIKYLRDYIRHNEIPEGENKDIF